MTRLKKKRKQTRSLKPQTLHPAMTGYKTLYNADLPLQLKEKKE